VRFYTWQRAGLADGGSSDAIRGVAGGEGSYGAAKPDGVIHRYPFNTPVLSLIRRCPPVDRERIRWSGPTLDMIWLICLNTPRPGS
jgi:hypothetical protein